MSALFAKCPFCGKVFNAWAESATRLTVDGSVRYAHVKCAADAATESPTVVQSPQSTAAQEPVTPVIEANNVPSLKRPAR
jgi:hypothetical protein